MTSFIVALKNAWAMIFGWMPGPFAAITSILVGLLIIITLIKIIGAILDAIPFL